MRKENPSQMSLNQSQLLEEMILSDDRQGREDYSGPDIHHRSSQQLKDDDGQIPQYNLVDETDVHGLQRSSLQGLSVIRQRGVAEESVAGIHVCQPVARPASSEDDQIQDRNYEASSSHNPYEGMDSLQILRLWDLRRAQAAGAAQNEDSVAQAQHAEQEDEAHQFMIEQGVKENYKKTIYQTSAWQAIVFIVFTSILIDNGKEFLELKSDMPSAFYFMFSNQLLYVFGFVFNLTGICLVNYYTIMIRIAYGLLAFLFFFGFFGFYLAQQMFEILDQRK